MQTPAELTRLADFLNGLPIMGCSGGSPAARAGLRYGDIVLSIEGTPTPSWEAFFQAGAARGRPVSLSVFRQGRQLELRLELRGRPTPRALLEADARRSSLDVC